MLLVLSWGTGLRGTGVGVILTPAVPPPSTPSNGKSYKGIIVQRVDIVADMPSHFLALRMFIPRNMLFNNVIAMTKYSYSSIYDGFPDKYRL